MALQNDKSQVIFFSIGHGWCLKVSVSDKSDVCLLHLFMQVVNNRIVTEDSGMKGETEKKQSRSPSGSPRPSRGETSPKLVRLYYSPTICLAKVTYITDDNHNFYHV